MFHAARSAPKFGARSSQFEVDFRAVIDRKDRIVGEIIRRMEDGLRGNDQIELVLGDARFRSATELAVGERVLRAPKMLIAAGSHPQIPAIPGLERYVTSDQIMDVRELPQRFVVLGGGAVACEFAQMFRRFGSEVTMLIRGPRLLSREDPEIGAVLAEVFADEGIRVVFGTTVERVEPDGTAQRLHTAAEAFATDLLLVATGRVPSLDGLQLERAGIAHTPKGITVDRFMRTTAPNIWAAGDCTGGFMFTHVAVFEGVRAASNALGESYEADETFASRAVFCDPEVATFGLTEAEAIARGYSVKVGVQPMSSVGRARVMEETKGFIKFVLDAKDDTILGCHVIAPHGAEIIHAALVAANAGRSLDPIFIHPSLTEGLQSAAEATIMAVPRMTH